MHRSQQAPSKIFKSKVAIGIVLGDHGFGSNFTAENPCVMVVIAKSQEQLDDLVSQTEAITRDYNGRVAVVGFAQSSLLI